MSRFVWKKVTSLDDFLERRFAGSREKLKSAGQNPSTLCNACHNAFIANPKTNAALHNADSQQLWGEPNATNNLRKIFSHAAAELQTLFALRTESFDLATWIWHPGCTNISSTAPPREHSFPLKCKIIGSELLKWGRCSTV